MEHEDEHTPLNGSRAYVVSPQPRGEGADSMKTWRALGVILAVLVGAGSVTMGMGKAFFVTRDEYTAKEKSDVLVGDTLKRLEAQIGEQRNVIEKLSNKITDLQTDIALITKRTRR